MRDRLAVPGLALVASLIPKSALAHSAFPGIEGFYAGLLHPLVSFDQLLALLALGVMLGLGKPEWFGKSWLAFVVFTVIGVCFGLMGYLSNQTSPWLLSIGFVSAALVAVYPRGLFVPSLVLAGLCGTAIGLSSAPDPGPMRDTIFTVSGSFVGVNSVLILVSGGVVWFRDRFEQGWSIIALRILAAWIATISISMAALALAPQ